MVKCPKCSKEAPRAEKSWKYGLFLVEVYTCGKCGTRFREYSNKGKHSFTLKREKGKGYVKA